MLPYQYPITSNYKPILEKIYLFYKMIKNQYYDKCDYFNKKINLLKTLKPQVWIKQNRKFGIKIMVSLAKPMAKNNSILPSPILLDINDLLSKYNSDNELYPSSCCPEFGVQFSEKQLLFIFIICLCDIVLL